MNSGLKNNRSLEVLSVLAFVSLLVGFFFHVKIFFVVSTALLFIGLFVRSLSSRLSHIWLSFAELLGNINGKIVLGFIFFIILTPIALLSRFFKGDILQLKKRPDSKSFWIERNHHYQNTDLKDPW